RSAFSWPILAHLRMPKQDCLTAGLAVRSDKISPIQSRRFARERVKQCLGDRFWRVTTLANVDAIAISGEVLVAREPELIAVENVGERLRLGVSNLIFSFHVDGAQRYQPIGSDLHRVEGLEAWPDVVIVVQIEVTVTMNRLEYDLIVRPLQ